MGMLRPSEQNCTAWTMSVIVSTLQLVCSQSIPASVSKTWLSTSGRRKLTANVEPELCNGTGICHGGQTKVVANKRRNLSLMSVPDGLAKAAGLEERRCAVLLHTNGVLVHVGHIEESE